MGQVRLTPRSGATIESVAHALERLVPADIVNLVSGRQRYTQFTNGDGGILDDLIVTAMGDHLWLVVNAARKHDDIERMRVLLATDCEIEVLETRALIALQGPAAVEAFAHLVPECSGLSFMQAAIWSLDGDALLISRSGYTGEDGLEISVAGNRAEALARRLLEHDGVSPAGLGARDSLRLEAGLCLYGHDIDTTTTPVEAGLAWSIQKRRRLEGGFPGVDVIRAQLRDGPTRRRVGLRILGRAPVREGAPIRDASGRCLGRVTSGAFGPSVAGPVAMGYVQRESAVPGTAVEIGRRNAWVEAEVSVLPFVQHRYHQKAVTDAREIRS